MDKLVNWLTIEFSPRVSKFTNNPWIQTLTTALMTTVPIIMIGSVVSIYNVFAGYFSFMPDLSAVYDYSFGMLSLIAAPLIGYFGMEKFNMNKSKIGCGLVALCVFMMMIRPEVADFTATIKFGRFGGSGMIPAFFGGLLTVLVFYLYNKAQLFKKSSIPEFLINWFNIIIPGFVALLITQILNYNLNLDLFQLIIDIFSPITSIAQTLPGFILISFIPVFIYSLGINSWFFNPITTPITLAGINANIAAVSSGGIPENIVTVEVMYSVMYVGGMGCTLALAILLLFSKSKRLKSIGRVTFIPSVFNINEPLVFGAPIAMNPLFMLPMWISSILSPIIIWFTMKSGLVSIPSQLMRIGQVPMPISSYLVTNDWRAILLWIVLLAMAAVIWYPFFKAYEKQCLQEELTVEGEKNA